MTSNQSDLDPHFVKCIGYLYSSKTLKKGDNVPLQYMLEEAIFQKSGIVKDFTELFQSVLPQREAEEITIVEESKGSSSDNELELDLFKEDLMCIVCNGMDVAAKNRLLECGDCHSLYHQECHNPVVVGDDTFENWVCNNCKEASVKVVMNSPEKKEVVPLVVTTSITKTSSTSSKTASSSSSHHRHSSSSKSSSSSSKSSDKYKSSSSKSSSPSHSSTSKSSSSSNSTPSTSSSSSRSNLQPNINIISADKRIQNMKRKAATKFQEKRKLPR